MKVSWEDRPFDSLASWPTAIDPLAQYCHGLVEQRLGRWWAHVPDVIDEQVGSTREEAKAILETTLLLKGSLE